MSVTYNGTLVDNIVVNDTSISTSRTYYTQSELDSIATAVSQKSGGGQITGSSVSSIITDIGNIETGDDNVIMWNVNSNFLAYCHACDVEKEETNASHYMGSTYQKLPLTNIQKKYYIESSSYHSIDLSSISFQCSWSIRISNKWSSDSVVYLYIYAANGEYVQLDYSLSGNTGLYYMSYSLNCNTNYNNGTYAQNIRTLANKSPISHMGISARALTGNSGIPYTALNISCSITKI